MSIPGMRKVIDVNGGDVTYQVSKLLRNRSQVSIFDLYCIQLSSGYVGSGVTNYLYTDAPFPIYVNQIQFQATSSGLTTLNDTYTPGVFKREAYTFAVGTQAESVKLTWWPKNATGLTFSNFRWAISAGYMDGCNVFINRAFCIGSKLLGTTLMWRSWMRNVTVYRDYIEFDLPSLMQLFHDIKLPTQLVEVSDRDQPYIGFGNTQLLYTGSAGPPAGTPYDIQYSIPSGAPGVTNIVTDHALKDGFIVGTQASYAQNGSSPPPLYRVRDNITIPSSGPRTLHIYPYEPFPLTNLGGTYNLIGYPAQITGGNRPGFPTVPVPEMNV